METNSLIEEKNPFETDGNREEMIKLRLEAADLKLRLLKIKERQMELLNQEKKKKMKESTPPPLKERKEIRKETLKQLQQHRADTRERELVDCQAPAIYLRL